MMQANEKFLLRDVKNEGLYLLPYVKLHFEDIVIMKQNHCFRTQKTIFLTSKILNFICPPAFLTALTTPNVENSLKDYGP